MGREVTTWGDGDDKVSLGDEVMIWEGGLRNYRPVIGVVTKIGRTLLYVKRGRWGEYVFELKSRRLKNSYHTSYQTLARYRSEEERKQLTAELKSLGIGPAEEAWRGRGWEDWSIRQLRELIECVRSIRDVRVAASGADE